MEIIVILLSLFFLMFIAFRGFSVILFAPICALFAVLLTEPGYVMPFYSGIFMDKMVGFIKSYFPVFLLGAIFGKVMEMSGFVKSIANTVVKVIGTSRAMLAIVIVGAILTYGGVSVFVVVFAIYPFAAELFKAADIPKRLIPVTIALGAFTFSMDALPGSPQIQNIIPTSFFKTTTWAAPWLGVIGAIFVFTVGMIYLEWRRRKAKAAGEGYGSNHKNEPQQISDVKLPNFFIAILPLIIVGVFNRVFTNLIPKFYGTQFDFTKIDLANVNVVDITKETSIWAIEGALVLGIVTVIVFSFKQMKMNFNANINVAIGGALLATINTASEYGYGAVISMLPGFKTINQAMSNTFTNPLVNEAVTTTTLAGITASSSGGMSIALAAMSEKYLEQAQKFGIEPEVLHRVASMASGGMDTLPHSGAIITLLVVTGLTHKQSYFDIFVLTIIKTIAAFFIIGVYYLFGIV